MQDKHVTITWVLKCVFSFALMSLSIFIKLLHHSHCPKKSTWSFRFYVPASSTASLPCFRNHLWEVRSLDRFQTLNRSLKCDQVNTYVKTKCNQSDSPQMSSMWVFSQIKGFPFFYESLKHTPSHTFGSCDFYISWNTNGWIIGYRRTLTEKYILRKSNQIDIFFKKKKKKRAVQALTISCQHCRR